MRRFRINKELVCVSFFLYMCTTVAHKKGYGFDAFINRIAFVVFVGVTLLYVIKKRIVPYRKAYFTTGRVAFICFYLISAIWSRNWEYWADKGIRNSLIQIILACILLSMAIENQLVCEQYLQAFLFSIVYMSVLLVIQTPISEWGTERIGSALGINSNLVGIRCATGSIISMFFADTRKSRKILYLAIAMALICISLFSGSRKGILIFGIGYVIYSCGKARSSSRFFIRCVESLALLGLVLYLSMRIPGLYRVMGRRLLSIFKGATVDVWAMRSLEERRYFRQYAMEMFLNSPLIGYGGNGFVAEMERIGSSSVTYSHCNYTELLSTLGIIGLLVYYYPIVRCLKSCIKLHQKKHSYQVCLCIALVISTVVSEYYYVSYYVIEIQLLLFLISMYVYFLRRNDRRIGYE